MKIGIIGAGFAGLAAADDLRQAGNEVVVFEAAAAVGGLAAGFRAQSWSAEIEKHYHHIFTTDTAVRKWLADLGLHQALEFRRVRTATLQEGGIRSLDSVMSLLRYQPLSWLGRWRMGLGLALLKFWPWGVQLDRFSAAAWIKPVMGAEVWQKIWRPLFVGKFGRFAEKINLAWFWARIVARSAELGYYQGGFGELARLIAAKLVTRGVKLHLKTPVESLNFDQTSFEVVTRLGREKFDQILVAAESGVAQKLLAPLVKTSAQKSWLAQTKKLQGLGAKTLVLELDRPFFRDATYWLNINESGWPFLAVVEQTQLTGRQKYAGHTIVYVAKYGETSGVRGQAWFGRTATDLLTEYTPYLKQLAPDFETHLINSWVFDAKFAQPLVFTNHRLLVPQIATPWPKVFWASMQQVYPWDRGINFAVAIGRTAAQAMLQE